MAQLQSMAYDGGSLVNKKPLVEVEPVTDSNGYFDYGFGGGSSGGTQKQKIKVMGSPETSQ